MNKPPKFILQWKGITLATLEQAGRRELRLCEVSNPAAWMTMANVTGPPDNLFLRLAAAWADKDITLALVYTSAVGAPQYHYCDLTGVVMEGLFDFPGLSQVLILGYRFPAVLRFSTDIALLPHYARGGPDPTVITRKIAVPKETKEEVLPDIEVARYALRTFKISDGKLRSVVKSYNWEGGVAIAACLKNDPCESSPNENCDCGIYGTLNIKDLRRQYGSLASDCVAVIAAEGTTIIGDRGLRTAAARIVAYWCEEHSLPSVYHTTLETWTGKVPQVSYRSNHSIFAEQCPDAKYFGDLNEMLRAYKFEEEAQGFEYEDLGTTIQRPKGPLPDAEYERRYVHMLLAPDGTPIPWTYQGLNAVLAGDGFAMSWAMRRLAEAYTKQSPPQSALQSLIDKMESMHKAKGKWHKAKGK